MDDQLHGYLQNLSTIVDRAEMKIPKKQSEISKVKVRIYLSGEQRDLSRYIL